VNAPRSPLGSRSLLAAGKLGRRLAMRLSAVLWRDQDKTESDIAHLLGLSLQTARSLAASRTSWNPQCSSSD
jgi:hypothetical protein